MRAEEILLIRKFGFYNFSWRDEKPLGRAGGPNLHSAAFIETATFSRSSGDAAAIAASSLSRLRLFSLSFADIPALLATAPAYSSPYVLGKLG